VKARALVIFDVAYAIGAIGMFCIPHLFAAILVPVVSCSTAETHADYWVAALNRTGCKNNIAY